MKTKTILNGVLFISLVFSTFFFTGCSKENTTNKLLDTAAAEANKLCPMTVDYLTRCDSITRHESMTLAYYYTLNATKAELDSLHMDWSKVKDLLISGVKSNSQLTPLLALDVKFKHTYLDKTGQPVYETVVNPEEYKTK